VWELFHENSKNGRRLRLRDNARAIPPAPEPAGGPAIRLPPAEWPAEAAAPNALTPGHLSALLHSGRGGSPLAVVFVHLTGVDGVADGLYRHDAASGGLRVVRRDVHGARVAGALVVPSGIAPRLWLFVAGSLARAAALHGERGYRSALIAAGERIAGIDEAAKRLGSGVLRPDFYDREIDALVGLDGLSEAVLAVLTLVPGAG
jgi:hypothetical protein